MVFSLEALKAGSGDSFLLHVGPGADPSLVVIDGGPMGAFGHSLAPRLAQLKAERTPDADLRIPLLMVSHADDDHMHGVLDLLASLLERKDVGKDAGYRIDAMWLNTFDDVVGRDAPLFAEAARSEVGVPALTGEIPPGLSISHSAALVLAGVPSARELQGRADLLGIPVNPPLQQPMTSGGTGRAMFPTPVAGLGIRILWPSDPRIDEFHEQLGLVLEVKGLMGDGGEAEASQYLENAVYDLSSMVVLFEAGGEEMLLCGDARGDVILRGLRDADLLDSDGRRHVGVLKLPHHGCDRHVDTEFFRSVTADHYVVSGDGTNGNPTLATFQMLFDARRGDDQPYTLDLTHAPSEYRSYRGRPYPVERLMSLIREEQKAGQRFVVRSPRTGEPSVRIDLLDPFPGN